MSSVFIEKLVDTRGILTKSKDPRSILDGLSLESLRYESSHAASVPSDPHPAAAAAAAAW